MILERPPHVSVVALLEAEGLPASDLTDAHLEHFFFTGCARGELMAAIVNDGLHLKLVRCAAALECGKTSWFHEISPLLAAGDA